MQIQEYIREDGSNPYQQWFDSLDAMAAAKVTVARTTSFRIFEFDRTVLRELYQEYKKRKKEASDKEEAKNEETRKKKKKKR